ncbi:class I SAM-dependent methyltransferase [Kitasatospora sp. NPDC056327]|uniref:class I SAM-dependent methyltransferase n=1 Tax=Kitasatospora sp. NPDC056327 TaxID=3345785 RepID=UPI0035D7A538
MKKTPAPDDWLATNRANWDGRVPVHVASEFYDVAGFVEGGDPMRAFEVDEVGDVTGRTLLHLQCHFGLDTLSWARRGATVTGLDFSGPAVEAATELAGRIGADTARFVVSDVYGAVEALGGRTFDVVYTGMGALCWLPDIARWARTAAALVSPGGFLYLAEFHPFADILGDDGRTVEYDYFDRDATVWDDPSTYTDGEVPPTAPTVTVEWQHGIGEVVSALVAAGLRIEFLHEHDFTLFARFPVLEHDRGYRYPAGRPRVPLMYSIRASRPERSAPAERPGPTP